MMLWLQQPEQIRHHCNIFSVGHTLKTHFQTTVPQQKIIEIQQGTTVYNANKDMKTIKTNHTFTLNHIPNATPHANIPWSVSLNYNILALAFFWAI